MSAETSAPKPGHDVARAPQTVPGPWRTSWRISASSSNVFANAGTAVTSLLLMPLLEVVFVIAIAASMGSSEVLITAYAGVLLTAALAVMNGIVSAVTTDRFLGVLQDLLLSGGFSPVYWAGKAGIPAVRAAAVAVPMLAGIWAVDPSHSARPLLAALVLLPAALLVGAAVGIAAGTISAGIQDPYLIGNVLSLALPITAGVMAPLALYPLWLAVPAHMLPLTGLIEGFRVLASGGGGALGWPLLRELLVDALWLIAGLASAQAVIRALRSGKRTEEIW